MRIIHRLTKWFAVRSYRTRLGRLLVKRYGRERHYTPQQVLTTIKLSGLSERFAPYACAMFCSGRAYSEFVAGHVPKAGVTVDPVKHSSVLLWAGVLNDDWPDHRDVVADLGDSHWDQSSPDVGSHFPGEASHFGDGHDGGAGGHDGGSHDGGGDGSQ